MRVNSLLMPFSEQRIRFCEPRFSIGVTEEIDCVLQTGMLREGSVTRRFEECFKHRTGAKYAYSVSSGSAALQCAVQSSVPKGSKVLVPAFTFIASVSSVVHSGCVPVFVDVDPETFLFDVEDAWEKVDEDTRAVLPVHLFGNIVDIERLVELSEEYDLRVIHDAAQALGSTYQGVEIGALNDVCCYSFYPSKIITTGEGGMVTSNDEELDYRGRLVKSHGESERYYHELLGYNYRGDEIAAVLGLDQMTRLEGYLEKRRSIARYYDLAIRNIDGLNSQRMTRGTDSCYNYYTVRVDDKSGLSRDQIVEDLQNMNIEAAVHYPRALTEQPALREYIKQSCRVAENLARRVFSIPIHPYLTEEETETVVMGLRCAVNRQS